MAVGGFVSTEANREGHLNSDSLAWLTAELAEFNRRRRWENLSPKDLAMSVAIEAAELMEHFQWGEDLSSTDLGEVGLEAADVLIYLLHLCRLLDIDLGRRVVDKLAINETRFPGFQN